MSLEKQVCSLNLAKRLMELGVKQESFCYWFTQSNAVPVVPLYGDDAERVFANWGAKKPPSSNGGLWSAFTVAELGELLPPYFCTVNGSSTAQWSCRKWSHGIIDAEVPTQYAETEADCRALMLIYLLEHSLITV
jgi:hypothetical protein